MRYRWHDLYWDLYYVPHYNTLSSTLTNTILVNKKYFFYLQSGEKSDWQSIFYIAAAIYMIGAVLYGLFASGDEQTWARFHSNLLIDSDTSDTEDLPYGDSNCNWVDAQDRRLKVGNSAKNHKFQFTSGILSVKTLLGRVLRVCEAFFL